MSKKQTPVVTDERTKQNISKAAVITLVCLWVGLVIYAVYKAIKFGIGSITEEILIMCGTLFVFFCAQYSKGDIDLPKSLNGKALSVGTDKHAKRSRLMSYFAESFIDSCLLAALNIILLKMNPYYTVTKLVSLSTVNATLVVNFFIDLGILWLLFFAVCVWWGEKNVKKYNEQTQQEDNFDNTLK